MCVNRATKVCLMENELLIIEKWGVEMESRTDAVWAGHMAVIQYSLKCKIMWCENISRH